MNSMQREKKHTHTKQLNKSIPRHGARLVESTQHVNAACGSLFLSAKLFGFFSHVYVAKERYNDWLVEILFVCRRINDVLFISHTASMVAGSSTSTATNHFSFHRRCYAIAAEFVIRCDAPSFIVCHTENGFTSNEWTTLQGKRIAVGRVDRFRCIMQ